MTNDEKSNVELTFGTRILAELNKVYLEYQLESLKDFGAADRNTTVINAEIAHGERIQRQFTMYSSLISYLSLKQI